MNATDTINKGGFILCSMLAAWIVYKFPSAKQEPLTKFEYHACQTKPFEIDSTNQSCINLTQASNFINLNNFMSWYPVWNLGIRQYDRYTAVYDISAKTVYLPNGLTLEAHSGKGAFKDAPQYVSAKGRGPTPPHVYSLIYRERLFHGVQAIRLIPKSQKDIYNRNGLLAHPPFLGPGGDSHGCITFKNYGLFLNAYKSGIIHRLAVVSKLD